MLRDAHQAPELPLCFSGPLTKNIALLFLGLHSLCCLMGVEQCTPSSVGLCVFFLLFKGCVFVTGHRTVLPRRLETLRSRRHHRLDLWRGPCVMGALIRSGTENTLRALETKEFLHQPLKAFPVRCAFAFLATLDSAASSLFALIPGDGNGNDTLRR